MREPVARSSAADQAERVPERIEARVVEIVRDLHSELHPRLRNTVAVTIDSDLDRQLAFDSLSRAELVLRLDRAFGIRLPDRLIGEAETPRDLAEAIAAGPAPTFSVSSRLEELPHTLAKLEEPVGATTLIEVLQARLLSEPDRIHLHIARSSGAEDTLTFRQLDLKARAVAGGLIECGLRGGDRVGIMLPSEVGFFSAFFGVLFAGGIPVPIYPPFRRSQVEDHLRRQAGILRNAEARILIASDDVRGVGHLLFGLVATLQHVRTVAELSTGETIGGSMPASAETVALIQYTSGSTGDPKGVVLTHANLLANIRAMGAVLEASSSDRVVSWLPLYHDMGLIGCWLGSLYYGAVAVIMPPLAFLADPARWLRTIHQHRATLSAAPNFAFELCLKAIRDEDIQGLDLSCLRAVMNGAEPVTASTIRRFAARFGKFGFPTVAMAPVYGLAENAVGLAFPPIGRVPIIDRVARAALGRDGIAQPTDKAQAMELVACGQPLPGHEIRIVDDAGRELPERREGRLQFKGPSATAGYFRNPEKNRSLFEGEWLESGDRAYMAGGDVYVTGRIKDMIKRAGRNIFPQELEEIVGGMEGIRKGCVAVFATPDPRSGTERLVVLAETNLAEPEQLTALRQGIIEKSRTLLDLPADEVLLVPPRTVPKTSSGKIRRSAARALYESGPLSKVAPSLRLQVARLLWAGIAPRFRRWGARLGEWAYALWWWLSLGLAAGIAWLLVLVLPRRSWRHAALRASCHSWFRAVGIAVVVTSRSKLPEQRVFVVSNHSSYLDGAVLSTAIPGELSFVAKSELRRQVVASAFLRRLGTIFVRRSETQGSIEDTQTALARARAGDRLAWFPEGTFRRMPGLLPFHLGAFQTACQAGVAVVPVAIRGTRSIFRAGQWFPRRGSVTVTIEEAIVPGGADFGAALRLRDAVRTKILGLVGEPDLAREHVEPPSA
jgi:1-acyl-sn-glycerol-3-phosphate acyltransferase